GSLGSSHGLFEVVDGIFTRVNFNDVQAVAARIHRQVNGQNLLALEVLLLFVVLAVPGTKALRANGFGQVANGGVTVVLDEHDDDFDAFGNGGDKFGVEHEVGTVAYHDHHVAVITLDIEPTFGADPAGDFIAHAGKGVFHVIPQWVAHAPELLQITW